MTRRSYLMIAITFAILSLFLFQEKAFGKIIQEEGAALPLQHTVNFIGTTITCVNNVADERTDCTLNPVTPDTTQTISGLKSFTGCLQVGVVSTDNQICNTVTGSGSATLYIGNSSINVTAPSDIRIKQDISPWDDNITTKITSLDASRFAYVWDPAIQHYGFIAQDFERAFPNMVTVRSDGYKQIEYANFIPYLIKAIQESDARVRKLEAERGQYP